MVFKRRSGGSNCGYGIVQEQHQIFGGRVGSSPNAVKRQLDDLGLLGKTAADKFIPHPYLLGSVEQRVALLQGLMDTDGTVNIANNQLRYTTISERLAQDVRELVHSLGGTVSVATERNS